MYFVAMPLAAPVLTLPSWLASMMARSPPVFVSYRWTWKRDPVRMAE